MSAVEVSTPTKPRIARRAPCRSLPRSLRARAAISGRSTIPKAKSKGGFAERDGIGPAAAVCSEVETVIVTWDAELPGVIVAGLKATVAPGGRPVAERVIAEVKLPLGVMVSGIPTLWPGMTV